ncbi:hypothetical protein VTL71DRAFT_5465 [Oculimacula yallundae]|uniref:GA4 desaturase n=1 Tax=Oculimacula yallundae TaxID=86028 RepID=A0ABR4C162_9HELO
MSVPLASTPKVLQAAFNYYSDPSPPEPNEIALVVGGSSKTTSSIQPVTDLRNLPFPLASYNHATHGFQILTQDLPIDPSYSSIHDEKAITEIYYPAMSSLLKEQLGVRATAIVNHTLRDISAENLAEGGVKGTQPFFSAHSDYTPGGSRSQLRAMTEEWSCPSQTGPERKLFFRLRDEIIAAEDKAMTFAGLEPGNGDLLAGKGGQWDWDGKNYSGPRYGIFSIWRPWEVVKRDPLALLVAPEDELRWEALPRSYKKRFGYLEEYYSENVLVRPPDEGRSHEWCYLSEQAPEEVLAIKFYDSEALRRGDGSVRLMCPHSAFRIEGTEDEMPRRSSELRVWCIW